MCTPPSWQGPATAWRRAPNPLGGTSDAPTARFTILQHSENGGTSRFEGEDDFVTGDVSYTLMVEGEHSQQALHR